MECELRPVSSADWAFLFRVFSENRANAFAAAGLDDNQLRSLLQMQFQAQTQQYARDFPNSQQHIIKHNGEAVGQIITNETDCEVRIVDIAILPEFQNKGLGTAILKNIISNACERRKSVQLSVESTNAAIHLYTRLGFQKSRSNGVYVEMELPSSD